MKKQFFSIFLIMGIFYSFSITNRVQAQEGATAEQKTDKVQKTEKSKVEAGVVKDNSNGFTKNWFFGVKGGATFFLSPLKSNPFSWGAAASLGKQLNSKTALRVDYLYGNLKSDGDFSQMNPDGSYYYNTLASNVDFMEIAMVLKLSVNDFFYSRSPKYLRELYVFGGGAYTMFRTKITDKDGKFVTGTGYSVSGEQEAMAGSVAVPLGIGVTYKLGSSDIVNLNAEFGYRFAQTEGLDGGLTGNTSNYTFSSLGLLFNLGKPTLSPQQITSDQVRQDVTEEISDKFNKEIDNKIASGTKPLKEELAKQSVLVAGNQEQLAILQEEMEARTEAIKEQIGGKHEGGTSGTSGSTGNYSGVGGIDVVSVYFAFNSTYITPAMEREIATLAKVLKKNKNLKLEIVGNASNIGSPEYNLQLSQKRAEAVLSILVNEFKISADRLNISNNGLTDPLAENIKSINRRVDLIIK